MEHFLNFFWMFVSMLLFVHWARAVKTNAPAGKIAKALIALILLVVILMPVISATDDLIAMSSLLDPEHPEHMVRRGEMGLLELAHGTVSVLELVCFVLLLVDLSFLRRRLTSVFLRTKTARTLSAFARALFVRPPPATAFLTA